MQTPTTKTPKLPPPTGALSPDEKRAKMLRPFGAALIAAGAVLGKFIVWDLLEAAKRGEEISYSRKLVMLVALLPTFGLALLVLGDKGFKMVQGIRKDKLTAKDVGVIALILVPAMAFLYWFENELDKLGYSRR